MVATSVCPLTAKQGNLLRTRTPDELFASYGSYFGTPLPLYLKEKYFCQPVHEYYCEDSGLCWYSPLILGDGEFYKTLADTYAWYYSSGSWDKRSAMEIIKKMPTPKVVEVGSGGGWFLSELSKLGVNNFGVELNPQAKEIGRANGLTIYSTEDASYINENASVLCLFQTLEHVQDPVKFLNTYIKIFEPRTLLISTPCIESLLGHTNDPLCWPPHHATAWSEKSFKVLAEKIGCVLTSISYEALNYQEFESRLRREGSRKLFNMPYIPPGFLGRAVYYLASMLKAHWAVRSHSILGVFVRERA